MKQLLTLALLFTPCINMAADTQKLITPNTVLVDDKPVQITPQTILELSPSLPQKLQGKTREEIDQILLQDAAINTGEAFGICGNDTIKLLPWYNCYAKRTGGANYAINAAHSFDNLDQGYFWNDRQYHFEQLNRTLNSDILTYCNPSRLAFALIGAQAIAEHKLDLIGTPKTALYSTDGASADDAHTVIFQQPIVNAITLKQQLEQKEGLNDEQVRQLCTFIEATGFWNPADNILVDKSGKVWCFGQQPNNSRPQDFYYANEARYHGNIVCGYKDRECGLKRLFDRDRETANLDTWKKIISFARHSSTFTAPNYNPGYLKEMLAFLDEEEKNLGIAKPNNVKPAKR